jgi:hypothetical protein
MGKNNVIPSYAVSQFVENLHWSAWSLASKILVIYGGLMLIALGLAYLGSLADARTIRDVGVWVKPMKFMAASALFAWTTVWLVSIPNTSVDRGQAYQWIAALIIVTSLISGYLCNLLESCSESGKVNFERHA